jgi:hypothetical protein
VAAGKLDTTVRQLALLLVFIGVFFNPNWPTLHSMFSKRLQASFQPSVLQNKWKRPAGVPETIATWAELEQQSRCDHRPGKSRICHRWI